MTTKANQARRIPSASRTDWVPVSLMRVSDQAQRDFKQARVDELVAGFDPEKLGILVVSKRDGVFWVVDGQHRMHVLRAVGWGDQKAQCEIYEGLTVADEAELFLGRNDNLAVTALAKFKVAVVAERDEQVEIDRIVRSAGFRIGTGSPGAISAIGTIERIYERLGGQALARSLVVIGDSFGTAGLMGPVIEAVAMVLHRYGSDLADDQKTIARLREYRGGIGAIDTAANQTRTATEYAKTQCLAAAVVVAYNKPRGGPKLAPWFQAEAGS